MRDRIGMSFGVRVGARRRERSRGQSFTEFALALPVFMLVVLIGLDFGRGLMSFVTLQQTARVGASYAASHAWHWSTSPAVRDQYADLIRREAAGMIQDCAIPDPAPDPQFPAGTDIGGEAVVSLSCDFHLLTPLLSLFMPNPLTLGTKTTFPIPHGTIAGPAGPGGGAPGSGTGAVIGTQPVSASGQSPLEIWFLDLTQTAEDQPVASSWRWDFGDGAVTGCPSQGTESTDVTNWHNPCHLFTNSGSANVTRTVTLTACNPSGCVSGTKLITVQSSAPAPAACFTMSPTSGTAPQPVNFNSTCTTASPTSWLWEFGDGSTSGCASEPNVTALQNPCHRFTTAGTFNVTLTATNGIGSGNVTHPITINSPPSCGPVPNFVNQAAKPNNFANIQAIWSAPGFTGPIVWTDLNGNPSTPTSNTGNHTVKSQVPSAGTFPLCSTTLTLRWS